jgi:hypothetical protein
LRRDGWRCQACGSFTNLQIHHKEFRSRCGDDSDRERIAAIPVREGRSPRSRTQQPLDREELSYGRDAGGGGTAVRVSIRRAQVHGPATSIGVVFMEENAVILASLPRVLESPRKICLFKSAKTLVHSS